MAYVTFLLICLSALALHVAALRPQDAAEGASHYDVCIIGGGSAGTYTAVRLQQMGKSVALIEKTGRLGGQVDTYIDPTSSKTIDYGVKLFHNTSIVTDYFASLDVLLAPFSGFVADQTNVYADLATGIDVPTPSPPAGNVTEALLRYAALLDHKYPYLSNGFKLPSPVPEDLLIPWGDFIKKHNLEAISNTIYGIVGGPGNILAQPTIYVAKNYGAAQVRISLEGRLVTEAHGDNQALYVAALASLRKHGSHVLLSSNVTHAVRSGDMVEATIATPSGLQTIVASKLVVTIPPKACTLDHFLHLSSDEETLFNHFNNSYIWASLVANSGIPHDASLANVDPKAFLGIPPMPAVFGTEPTDVRDLHIAWYGSPVYISDDEVKAKIVESLATWKKDTKSSEDHVLKPEIVAFAGHNPYMLTVSVDAIQNSFYDRLNELQGKRNTFWTGAAWQTQDSSQIWSFTEREILPKVLASLG